MVAAEEANRAKDHFLSVLSHELRTPLTPVLTGASLLGRERLSEDGHVVVEVADSGIGIEAGALGTIFDAFAQAERSITRQFGGLGLGLTISRTLVEQHGGCIEARSEGRDKGSTFAVRLPLVSHGVPLAGGAVRPPTPALEGGRGLRILLVEEHGDSAERLAAVLELAGHSVATRPTWQPPWRRSRAPGSTCWSATWGCPTAAGSS